MSGVRLVPRAVALAVALVAFTVGCGGSSGPETVNGCTIEPGALCSGADLSGADLSGADLTKANLTNANLEGTNLSGANLSEANLGGAQIIDTDLSDADLTGANLQDATITDANTEGATLCGTIRTDGTTDDSSCPSSETTDTETETTETTTEGAEATVTSFVVGDLSCPSAGADGDIAVSWTTAQATAARLEVDGETADETGPSGSASLTVPCDGAEHTVSVTALSDAGDGETESETVSSG